MRYLRLAVALAVVAFVLAGVAAYSTRKILAREALTGWLQNRGIASEVEFRDFNIGGFDARLRIGPPRDPDVTAELAEVRYGFTGFWSGEPLGVRVTSVKLHRPVVKASFRGGKLSVGSLDPVIAEFTRKPPRPGAPQPEIVINKGVLRLDTDFGHIQADADVQMEDGRLMRLDARLAPAAFKGKGLLVLTGPGRLLAATTRDRFDVKLTAPLRRVEAAGLMASDADFTVSAQLPYPDPRQRRGDGAVNAAVTLAGKTIAAPGADLSEAQLDLRFDGRSEGMFETLVLRGQGSGQLSAAKAEMAGLQVRGLAASANASDIAWIRKDGERVRVTMFAKAAVDEARAGDLRLTSAETALQGGGALVGKSISLDLVGRAAAHGAYAGLGRPRAGDPTETAALKRALQSFSFEAPRVAIKAAGADLRVELGAPVRARSASGGQVVLTSARGPLYAASGGGFRVRSSGGGLPQADLAVSRYRLTPGGAVASLSLQAKGAFGPVIDGEVSTAGDLRLAGGSTAFTASRCTTLSLARLELGENDVEAVDGEICPTGAPLLSFANGGWRMRGQAKGVKADVPFLEARVAEAAGRIDASGQGADLRLQADVSLARVEDTATPLRFHPVLASGQARLASGAWDGAFAVTDPAGRRLGDAKLRHGVNGVGALEVDTGLLAFEDGGLQPGALSPMAAPIGSPVTGRARFAGQVGWTPEAFTSGGTLDIERLDFISAAGPVTGLSGQVAFTSLVPLVAAPGQVIRAESIEALGSLTDAKVTFGISDETLRVAGASLSIGGGELVLEPFAIPFASPDSWKGVLDFKGVQIHDMVETSPFADRVDFDARLSGHVPFEVTPQGVRIFDGRLRAIEPGRLSIRREALTTIAADGGAISAPEQSAPAQAIAEAVEAATAEPQATNTFTDFAYQAMEHLAFQEMEAEINSLTEGRLGVLFKIKGQHSPPQKQEIRLTIMELIQRKFLEKTLPLPSGTKVDLTLETSLNLDQLLKDFADYQALRGSQAIQPEQ
jgi:hypothetical protein